MSEINSIVVDLLGKGNKDNTITSVKIEDSPDNRRAFVNNAKQLVRSYIDNHDVIVDLKWGQITLSDDIPLTVLSILPLVVDGMSTFGKYNVYVQNKFRGSVNYGGMPSGLEIAMDRCMNRVSVGANSTFINAPEPVTMESAIMEQSKINRNMRSYDCYPQ